MHPKTVSAEFYVSKVKPLVARENRTTQQSVAKSWNTSEQQ